jgi:uncharacterized phage-associated protein
MDFRSMLPLRPRAPEAFDEEKAAEIAAFFVSKEGGVADVLKLAKLMYLAERESFKRYGAPLTGDRLCSMKDGPVLSESLNYIRGHGNPPKAWTRLFERRDGNAIRLQQSDLHQESLRRLSDADVELLMSVWERFGQMSTRDIWVYVHSELPEYEDPGVSSRPIKMQRLLAVLGYSEPEIEDIVERTEEENQSRAALKRATV